MSWRDGNIALSLCLYCAGWVAGGVYHRFDVAACLLLSALYLKLTLREPK